jgi:hypothetical protein
MCNMKKASKLSILMALALLGNLVFSACGAATPTPEPVPTISVEAIQTSAVATFASGLTQTAIAMPTLTPTGTPVPTLTALPMNTGVAGTPTGTCYGLTAVKDVTVPDKTSMTSGAGFTKTWLVKNTGTCTWEAGFKLVLVSGEAMGGATLILTDPVSVGAEVELSVLMTAPTKTGTLRGDWRMATASGAYFGDYLWVIIVVGAAGTPSPTSTP